MNDSDRVWRECGLRSAVLAGDERAWQTLYEESFDLLAKYVAWRCAGLRELSEEMVQETWLTAVRRIRSFDPERGSFAGWLRGIAANLIRNRLRRRLDRFQSLENLRNGQCASAPAADAVLQNREQAERLARVLAELPDHYEAVLRAKYVEQQPVADIAEAWQQTPKAIESLLTRLAKRYAMHIRAWRTTAVSDTSIPSQDSVERFLECASELPRARDSRQTLLLQTQRLLRRRRRTKRLGYVAALVACYFAGAATVRGWTQWSSGRTAFDLGERALQLAQSNGESTRTAVPTPSKVSLPIQQDPDVPATVVESMAARIPGQRGILFRTAGDRYLLELGDVESAVRCYRRSLDACPDQELVVASDDSWLLMALKQARQKERSNAKNDG